MGIQSRLRETVLGKRICRNMLKLSHNKGGMNMYEPSTDCFGNVYKFILSLSNESHEGRDGIQICRNNRETLRCPETWLAKFPSSNGNPWETQIEK